MRTLFDGTSLRGATLGPVPAAKRADNTALDTERSRTARVCSVSTMVGLLTVSGDVAK